MVETDFTFSCCTHCRSRISSIGIYAWAYTTKLGVHIRSTAVSSIIAAFHIVVDVITIPVSNPMARVTSCCCWSSCCPSCSLGSGEASCSNQIYLVTFMGLAVDTSFNFTKISNITKCFSDISISEIEQCRQKIWRHFSNKMILKLKLSKNRFYKKMLMCKLIFFNKKKVW